MQFPRADLTAQSVANRRKDRTHAQALGSIGGGAIVRPFLHAATLFLLFSPTFCHAVPVCPTSITSVTPSTWIAGQSTNVTVTGTGFADPGTGDCWFPGIDFVVNFDTGSMATVPMNIVSESEATLTVIPDADDATQTACGFVTETILGRAMAPAATRANARVARAATPAATTPSSCIADGGIPIQIIGSCTTPTITSVTPSTWFAGKTYGNVVIKGTNFITTAKATDACPVTPVVITAADGSTVPVSGVTVDSKTKITLTVAPPASDPTESATVVAGTSPSTSTPPTPVQILGNQILCDPSMPVCGGNVISVIDGTGAIPNTSAVVGQPIILTTPALPSGITATKTIWTVGGTKIAGYAPTSSSASVTEVKAADLKKPAVNYYWVYSQDSAPITYEYCVNIPGVGNQCSTANAAFIVTGPGDAQMTTDAYGYLNIDMLIDKSPCLPTSEDKDPYLQYGNLNGYNKDVCPGDLTGDPGIVFTPPSTSSTGQYSFVQIVNKDTVKYTEGKIGSLSCPTNSGLDGVYPYPPWSDGRVADAPNVRLEQFYSRVSRNFTATMYLLWTSSIPNSIPVPIGSQKWQIAEASTTNSSYSTSQNWTQPVWSALGKDGDPVDYVKTMPSQSPFGYPTWKGPAKPIAISVCPTGNSNEDVDQQEVAQ